LSFSQSWWVDYIKILSIYFFSWHLRYPLATVLFSHGYSTVEAVGLRGRGAYAGRQWRHVPQPEKG